MAVYRTINTLSYIQACIYLDVFWRNLFCLLLLSLFTKATGSPRNILFIMSDDLRPEIGAYINQDTSPPLNQHIYTPNLDKLARKSIVFHKAYVQSPLCAPSRASLLTGRRPDTTDVHTFVNLRGRKRSNFTTIPQYFKQQGYTSIGMGKIFHDGPTPAYDDPISWSEPFWRGVPNHESECCSWKAVPETALKNKPLKDQQVADRAVKTIRKLAIARKDSKPFFLAVGFKKPHLPFVFPDKFLKYYPQDDIVLPENRDIPVNMPRIAWSPLTYLKTFDDINVLNLAHFKSIVPNNTVLALRRAYYACVTYIDHEIGRVLNELYSSRFSNNTIIVFLSDHGFHLGENGEWSKNTVFKLAAWAPLMLHIPGLTNQEIRTNQLVEFVDLFPTLVEAVGHKPLKICPRYSRKIALCAEGTSLLPLISKPDEPLKMAAFTQIMRSPKFFGYALITNKYRYTEWTFADRQTNITRIKWKETKAKELYDHLIDPKENYNIADNTNYTNIQANLRKILHLGWREAVIDKPSGGNRIYIDLDQRQSFVGNIEGEISKSKVNKMFSDSNITEMSRAGRNSTIKWHGNRRLYLPNPDPRTFLIETMISYILIFVLIGSFLALLCQRTIKGMHS
ncbi:iduronate 2-sulfatase-like [Mercenaria mercenaria]|uniref:iduronate 2-sulfatase-like n=1 Tax=Mercenaria mercenaria TaxID=6596 RepID=UPI00234EE020|nr:iduronate 2-sulfatase-like [Mercenaria mercenaria]